MKALRPYRARAMVLVRSPRLLRAVLGNAVALLAREQSVSNVLAGIRSDVSASIALVRAWLDGRYSEISAKSIVLLVAALAYFVAPVDAIPDFVPGIGLFDDVAVLSFVAVQLKQELDAFKAWQLAR